MSRLKFADIFPLFVCTLLLVLKRSTSDGFASITGTPASRPPTTTATTRHTNLATRFLQDITLLGFVIHRPPIFFSKTSVLVSTGVRELCSCQTPLFCLLFTDRHQTPACSSMCHLTLEFICDHPNCPDTREVFANRPYLSYVSSLPSSPRLEEGRHQVIAPLLHLWLVSPRDWNQSAQHTTMT